MFKTPHILNSSQSYLTHLPDNVLKPLLRSGLAQCSKYFFQLDLSLNEHKYSLSLKDIDPFIRFVKKYDHNIKIISIQLNSIFDPDIIKLIPHLLKLTGFQSLELSKCDITDQGLSKLRGMKQLQSLKLSECHKITDQCLAHLA